VTVLVTFAWALLGADHPPAAETRRWESREPAREPPVPTERPIPFLTDVVVAPQRVAEVVLPPRFFQLLSNPSLFCLTLSYGMVGYFQYLFFYWAQFYFEQVQQLPKGPSRLITSALTGSMGVGMVAGGWLSDRAPALLGPRLGLAVVPVVGLLLGAAATALGVFSPDPVTIDICFAAAMAAVGLGEGSFWTASVRIGGKRGGTAAGILNTGGNAGGLLAPVLTPLISTWFGWQAGLGLASVVCVLGAVLWWGVHPSQESSAVGPSTTIHYPGR
jgi:ACS family glucarate transporter-like MFS transporter